MQRKIAGKSLLGEEKVTEKVTDVTDVTDRVTEKVTDVTDRVTEKVTDIEVKILELISNDPAITTSKIAAMLSVTRKTISIHMKNLKKNNVIERIGSDRKGYWKILQIILQVLRSCCFNDKNRKETVPFCIVVEF